MKTSAGSGITEASYDLALQVFRLTQKFFRDGPDVLADELRQTALRVAGHLGEEGGRHRDEASGAAARMEALLIAARDLEYLSPEDFQRIRAGYREIAARLQLSSSRRAPWARQGEAEADEQ